MAVNADDLPSGTLAAVLGLASDDEGLLVAVANLWANSNLALMAAGTVKANLTGASASPDDVLVADLLTALDIGDTGRSEVAAAITALSTDAGADAVLGIDALTAIVAAAVDDEAAVQLLFDALKIPYFDTLPSAGDIIVALGTTAEVEGVPTVDFAAEATDLLDGTAGAFPDCATIIASLVFTNANSSSNVLTLDSGGSVTNFKHTTSENTTITPTNVVQGVPYNLVLTGGGTHTVSFVAGSRRMTSVANIAIASGEKYLVSYIYDGTDIIFLSSEELVEV